MMLWNQMIVGNPREIQRWHLCICVACFLCSVTLSSQLCWHLSGDINILITLILRLVMCQYVNMMWLYSHVNSVCYSLSTGPKYIHSLIYEVSS